jgi:hypothetical protein
MIAALEQPDADGETATMEVPSVEPDENGGLEGASSQGQGKGSRWNSMKHGLMAKELLPDDLAEEARQYTVMLTEHFKPTCPYERKQISIMGRAGAQLERLRALKVVDLQRAMDRAAVCWESDACAGVDKIASRLSREPFRVSRALARTKQGAEWLLQTWNGLRSVLDANRGWDEAQCSLALDMLGTRHELRIDGGSLSPESDHATLAAVVKGEVKRLEGLLKSHRFGLDWGAQMMAKAGMPGEEDLESKKHRKYEASARREYELAKAELLASQARVAAGESSAPPAAPVASTRARDSGYDFDSDHDADREQDSGPVASELLRMGSKLDTALADPAPADEEPEAETASVEVVQRAIVASSVSRAAVAPKPRMNRRLRRALAKQAEQADRRKTRPLL